MNTQLMGMNTQRSTILQMVYTLLGAYLSRASKNPKQKNNNLNLQGCKRQPEKTLKEHSVFCNLGLPLSAVLLVFWDKKTLKNIMKCCVILHNMILQDER